MTAPKPKRPKREAADATGTKKPHREGAVEKVDKQEAGRPGLARLMIRMDLGDGTSLRSRAVQKAKADSAAVDAATLGKIRRLQGRGGRK